jgi:hypothetical protein
VTRVQTTINPCLKRPPPARPEVQRTPCNYEACYDEANARKLAVWLFEIWNWADEAWKTCGEKK